MSGSIAERIDAGWQAARYWETECETARAERDALAAQLAALKKRVADAPVADVINGGFSDYPRPMVGEDVPFAIGTRVALLRLEDGE